MKLTLPKEVLASLPAPDSKGLVRATAALKLGADGEAELVSLNDQPVPVGADDEETEGETDYTAGMPTTAEMESKMYSNE